MYVYHPSHFHYVQLSITFPPRIISLLVPFIELDGQHSKFVSRLAQLDLSNSSTDVLHQNPHF